MTAQLVINNLTNNRDDLELDLSKIPNRVAVIMDGNGRWANARGLPRMEGHRQGANTLKEILRTCKDYGIETLTAYAFSTENWGRPEAEVNFLMGLFEKLLDRELAEMNREQVRISFIGDRDALPSSLQQIVNRAMELTKNNQGVNFNVAVNYGGRQEIVKACQDIALKVQQGQLDPNSINENIIKNHLEPTASQDIDLLIRTSGEMRVSNFLLWQIAYAEIYVTETYWPDFNRQEFLQALANYQQRDRRFGKLK